MCIIKGNVVHVYMVVRWSKNCLTRKFYHIKYFVHKNSRFTVYDNAHTLNTRKISGVSPPYIHVLIIASWLITGAILTGISSVRECPWHRSVTAESAHWAAGKGGCGEGQCRERHRDDKRKSMKSYKTPSRCRHLKKNKRIFMRQRREVDYHVCACMQGLTMLTSTVGWKEEIIIID